MTLYLFKQNRKDFDGSMTSIEELERLKVPRGEVTIVGLGRLGIRVAMNLIQVHRGGAKVVRVIDGQRSSEADIIH